VKKKGVHFEFAGKTEDEKLVAKNVYRVYETSGIPLDDLFEHLMTNNGMVSWVDFHLEAQANGMKHKRIMSKLEEAVIDVWGRDFWRVVQERLNKMFGTNDA